MKILRAFELIAAVMIVVGIMLALGKVAVDQIVLSATRPVTATVAIMPPSGDEIAAYIAGTKQSLKLIEMKERAEMDARIRGER